MRKYIIADNQELTRFALESLLQKDEESIVYRAYDKAGLVDASQKRVDGLTLADAIGKYSIIRRDVFEDITGSGILERFEFSIVLGAEITLGTECPVRKLFKTDGAAESIGIPGIGAGEHPIRNVHIHVLKAFGIQSRIQADAAYGSGIQEGDKTKSGQRCLRTNDTT